MPARKHIIVSLLQLRLCKIRQQVFVPAMPIHDDDFLTAVARHLVVSCRGSVAARRCRPRARFAGHNENITAYSCSFRAALRKHSADRSPAANTVHVFQNAERQQAGACASPMASRKSAAVSSLGERLDWAGQRKGKYAGEESHRLLKFRASFCNPPVGMTGNIVGHDRSEEFHRRRLAGDSP